MDKQAEVTPNVEGFLLYLTGALTQYDQRASRRRGYNPHAFGQYMEAVGRVRSSVSRYNKESTPEALQELKKSMQRYFLADFPPVKKTVKAIDTYLDTGKAPKYPISKDRIRAERVASWFVLRSDPVLSVEEIADLCPEMARQLVAAGWDDVRWSELQKVASAMSKEGVFWHQLDKAHRGLVGQVSSKLDYDPEQVVAFVVALLQDVNLHSEAAKVDKLLARVITAAKGDAWKGMPKGWTAQSRKKFWESLTGDAKHKVTKCIKEMKGKVDDPGAFCASLADRVEGKGWRSE